jgi:hypothetical protein
VRQLLLLPCQLIQIKTSRIKVRILFAEIGGVFARDLGTISWGTDVINFGAIAGAEVAREPFQFFATPDALNAADLAAIRADFPNIRKPGIFPLSVLTYGPVFARLVQDIRSRAMEEVMAEKYGVDLSDKPLMITVRGQAQKKDGRVHTDTKTKFVTCLLFLNDTWDKGNGRLRMLRGPKDLDDFVVEIPPHGGTLASFLRSDNSWHGHEPFEGERRYVMFNWMTSPAALERALSRHRFSAKVKRFNAFA